MASRAIIVQRAVEAVQNGGGIFASGLCHRLLIKAEFSRLVAIGTPLLGLQERGLSLRALEY